jgi:hypothetical protein
MRKLLFILAFLLQVTFASAQTSSIRLDSLYLTTRNLDINDDHPVSVFDTAHANRKVELNVLFSLSNVEELDILEIKYGTSQGASDVVNVSFQYVVIDNVPYIKLGNKKIPIVQGKIYFTRLIPESSLQRLNYVSIRARDNQGRYSNTITAQN